jgi:mannose-1-phosphate guanylyltransferase
LVLAGGDGTRLQELTRELCGVPIPKQYCRPLLGGRSLLELTLERARRVSAVEHTMVIVNRNHLAVARDQLRTLHDGNIIIQPSNRDTGPGLLFALEHIARRDRGATVAVFPSDHFVGDERAFSRYVQHAADVVSSLPEKIVVLGIRPEHPETGFGYITPSRRVRGDAAGAVAFHVGEFVEKPAPDRAQELFETGGLWNSFVMVFRVGRMLELIRGLMPTEVHRLDELRRRRRTDVEIYQEIEPWNFSERVLTRIPDHLLVVPVDGVHWNDWGTRASIERTFTALDRSPTWLTRQEPAIVAAAGA